MRRSHLLCIHRAAHLLNGNEMGRVPVALRITTRRCTTTAPQPTTTPVKVKVTFVTPGGARSVVSVPVGMTLMEAARDIANVDVEAACDGTCACSTCHMYLSEPHFKLLGEPSEDEMDMLDLAPAPKATSRLSCQVTVTKDMDGLEAVLPSDTSNQLK